MDLDQKLDLAKAHEEMGDIEAARKILKEILDSGSAGEKRVARTYLDELNRRSPEPIIPKRRPTRKREDVLQQRSRRRWGPVWSVAGAVLLGTTLALFFSSKRAWWAFPLYLFAALVGAWLFRLGRRMSAITAEELLERDKRPLVLYLRSFSDEGQTSDALADKSDVPVSEEEAVATVMNSLGPFVAIGDPGEDLPELGAARTYVGDDEWQQKVEDFMSAARLVVLRVGETPGFWWEVARVARKMPPEKILFLLPYPSSEDYEIKFREKAELHLPTKLPAYPKRRWLFSGKPVAVVQSILYFDSDWTAHVDLIRTTGFWGERSARFARALEAALEPVARNLKIPWVKVLEKKYRQSNRLAAAVILALIGFFVYLGA